MSKIPIIGDLFTPETPQINMPGRTPEENSLLREQTELLRQQRDALSKQMREQQLLAPLIFESAGITPKYDGSGNLVGYESSADPESKQRQKDIQKGFEERTLAALQGKLPVNPALLRDLDEEETTLRETLRKNLGEGYDISDPGIRALDKFTTTKTNLLEGARRGDLTLAEQLGLARQAASDIASTGTMQRFSAVAPSIFSPGIDSGVKLASAYNLPLSQLFGDRQLASQGVLSQAGMQFQASRDANAAINQILGIGSYFGAKKMFS